MKTPNVISESATTGQLRESLLEWESFLENGGRKIGDTARMVSKSVLGLEIVVWKQEAKSAILQIFCDPPIFEEFIQDLQVSMFYADPFGIEVYFSEEEGWNVRAGDKKISLPADGTIGAISLNLRGQLLWIPAEKCQDLDKAYREVREYKRLI